MPIETLSPTLNVGYRTENSQCQFYYLIGAPRLEISRLNNFWELLGQNQEAGERSLELREIRQEDRITMNIASDFNGKMIIVKKFSPQDPGYSPNQHRGYNILETYNRIDKIAKKALNTSLPLAMTAQERMRAFVRYVIARSHELQLNYVELIPSFGGVSEVTQIFDKLASGGSAISAAQPAPQENPRGHSLTASGTRRVHVIAYAFSNTPGMIIQNVVCTNTTTDTLIEWFIGGTQVNESVNQHRDLYQKGLKLLLDNGNVTIRNVSDEDRRKYNLPAEYQGFVIVTKGNIHEAFQCISNIKALKLDEKIIDNLKKVKRDCELTQRGEIAGLDLLMRRLPAFIRTQNSRPTTTTELEPPPAAPTPDAGRGAPAPAPTPAPTPAPVNAQPPGNVTGNTEGATPNPVNFPDPPPPQQPVDNQPNNTVVTEYPLPKPLLDLRDKIKLWALKKPQNMQMAYIVSLIAGFFALRFIFESRISPFAGRVFQVSTVMSGMIIVQIARMVFKNKPAEVTS